jgi:hypothetical protein
MLLIGIGVLAIVGAARFTVPLPENQRPFQVSTKFRAEALQTFDAIKRCDEYRTEAAIFYELRLREAEAALDSLGHQTEGVAEQNIETTLFNYLLAVERTRVDWEYFFPSKKKQLQRDEDIRMNASMKAMKICYR